MAAQNVQIKIIDTHLLFSSKCSIFFVASTLYIYITSLYKWGNNWHCALGTRVWLWFITYECIDWVIWKHWLSYKIYITFIMVLLTWQKICFSFFCLKKNCWCWLLRVVNPSSFGRVSFTSIVPTLKLFHSNLAEFVYITSLATTSLSTTSLSTHTGTYVTLFQWETVFPHPKWDL